MASRVSFYRLYELIIKSQLPLNAPRVPPQKPDITVMEDISRSILRDLPEPAENFSGIHFHPLKNQACYIRFYNHFRFLVSTDGRTVLYMKLKKSAPAFQYAPLAFLQTNVLSFCLIKLGMEVFHASSIEYQGKAIAFLGESGYGKSTLAAGFLGNDFKLLTDDVLAVKKAGKKFVTPPGVGHIKLLPKTIGKVLKTKKKSEGKLGPAAEKRVLSLPRNVLSEKSCPLGVIYILWPRSKKTSGQIWARKLRPKDALISLIKCSHNLILQNPARLRKQISFASKLTQSVPIRALSYPMDFGRFPALKALVLKDAERQFLQTPPK